MPRLLYRLPANAVSRRETSGEGPKSQSFTTLTSYDTTVLVALTEMEQHITPSDSELRDPPLPRSPSTGIGDKYKILLDIFVTDDFQLRENSELYTSDRAE
ncbi:hypothetical protein ABVK25_011596 [Lepraria finkii]|uniref:Uncharacterized protein n=1 Tax=Lepraria finkii TaxID=1340010 RepID=A0ABR4ALV1_9LECA